RAGVITWHPGVDVTARVHTADAHDVGACTEHLDPGRQFTVLQDYAIRYYKINVDAISCLGLPRHGQLRVGSLEDGKRSIAAASTVDIDPYSALGHDNTRLGIGPPLPPADNRRLIGGRQPLVVFKVR